MSGTPPIPRRVVSGLELFHGLAAAALDDVLVPARLRHLPKDTRIFNQGDGRVRSHALVEGSVRISQSGSDGAQVVVRFIGRGEMFGTAALFTNRRYPADADTLSDAVEISWSEADLLKLMDRHSQIAINAIRIIGKRLQESQNRVRELATQRVDRRIAHAVLRLAGQAGQDTEDGLTIGFPLRRKDIADICGTTLHSASRILTAWEREGWVVTRGHRLSIRQHGEIRRIAEDAEG